MGARRPSCLGVLANLCEMAKSQSRELDALRPPRRAEVPTEEQRFTGRRHLPPAARASAPASLTESSEEEPSSEAEEGLELKYAPQLSAEKSAPAPAPAPAPEPATPAAPEPVQVNDAKPGEYSSGPSPVLSHGVEGALYPQRFYGLEVSAPSTASTSQRRGQRRPHVLDPFPPVRPQALASCSSPPITIPAGGFGQLVPSWPPMAVASAVATAVVASEVDWRKKPRRSKGGDRLEPRRCSTCGTTETPKWRSSTLCNACGLKKKKQALSNVLHCSARDCSGPALPSPFPSALPPTQPRALPARLASHRSVSGTTLCPSRAAPQSLGSPARSTRARTRRPRSSPRRARSQWRRRPPRASCRRHRRWLIRF